jgi:hypothetical protein
MNTEYAVGSIRIRFESRARRRWLVALFYAGVAALGLAPFSVHANPLTVWIVSACGAFFAALFIVFTWVAGDPRIRGDEREMHRRDHAHYVAYRILLYGFVAVFSCYFVAIPAVRYLAGFVGPNGSTLFLDVVLSGSLRQHFLFMAVAILFPTLPQAILLWTEPDMEELQ